MKKNCAILSILLLALVFSFRAQAQWSAMPSSVVSHVEGQNVVINGKWYVFSGFYNAALHITTRTEMFDPATNRWTTLKPIPRPVTHVGVAVVGESVWLVGGFEGNHPGKSITQVQIYNTATDTWSTGPSLPEPLASGAVGKIGRKLHHFGGLKPDRRTDTGVHYVLDLDNQAAGWKKAATMPIARNHLSAAVLRGKVYAIGGQYGHDGGYYIDLPVLQVYDPLTNTWTRLANLPKSLSHSEPGTFVLNGKIIVTGGRHSRHYDVQDVYQYDPVRNTWSSLPNLPIGLRAPTAKVIGNQFYVTHGTSPDPQNLAWKRTISSQPINTLGISPGSLTLTAEQGKSVTKEILVWAVSGEPAYTLAAKDNPAWLSITPRTGSVNHEGGHVRLKANATGLSPGTYTTTLTITASGHSSAAIPIRFEVKAGTTPPPPPPPPPASDLVYRINVGGGAVAAEGLDWSAHGGGSGPFLSNGQGVSSRAFLGANATGAPDALFSSFRFDAGSAGDPLSSEMRWALPVAAGTYRVRLFFADTYAGTQAPGRRVFDVLAEGRPALTGLDVYAAGGPDAVVRELTVPVADGALNLDFLHRVENPLLSAIEVRRAGGEAACAASGTILREAWQNVGGRSVSSIPLHTAPTSTSQLAQFEGPRGAGDNYGSRIRGYLCAPATGQYTFWIAGDDDCELWLSTDDDPANKTRIAHFSGSTGFREWGKFATQQSAPVTLTAGKRYYVEALHKEGGGGDHVSVGWQLPDGALERPIQGNRLSPFAPAAAASAGGLARGLGAREARAYPNPFRNTIRLSLSGAWGTELTVTLLDPLGREAFRGSVPAEGSPADLEIGPEGARLPGGVYFLRLQGSDGTRQTIKLLKLP